MLVITTKCRSVTLWKTLNTEATKSIGLKGLSGGFRDKVGSLTFPKLVTMAPGGVRQRHLFDNQAWFRSLNSGIAGVSRNILLKSFGLSVRCVKD